ncbi:MAG TPA: hypothetical protein VMN79_10670 [Casimicrobiaceae bacterium]|nr:hypothetical protein [Casimicrobiaceae bacterium]
MSHRFALRHLTLVAAIAALPLTAFAWGSQAGDNGRQPIGADNDSPRQAIPDQASNDVQIHAQSGTAYYAATTAYERALYYCDRKPLELRDACRDAADARYGFPSEGYMAQPAYVETYPPYMTYYDPYPQARSPAYGSFDAYVASPDYYVYVPYPGDTSARDTNSLNRCAPLDGAARSDCLHGGAAGG